jgi:hypothetical protein
MVHLILLAILMYCSCQKVLGFTKSYYQVLHLRFNFTFVVLII